MKRLSILLFAMYGCGLSYAQTDTSDIFSMSLEELISFEVVSATKTKTKVQKAPSVVRMFTSRDFQKFGFVTIQDVLNTVPGMQIQEYRAGHHLVWIRGVQARYNNKVLFLVDGVPMRDSYYGNFLIDEMFPLESIERIEILNGPGSVLYGANSFSGVISITTKSKGRSAGADYGSFNTYSVQGEYDHSGLYANGNYYSSDGFQPEYMSDGNYREVDQSSYGQYGLLKYTKGNLTALAGVANYGQPYKYRSTKKEYYFDRMPIWGSVKYKHDISDDMSVNVNTYANYFQFTRNKIKYSDSETDEVKEMSVNPLNTMLLGTDVDFNYNTDKHGLIAGISWQQDRALDIHEEITFAKDPEDLGREEGLIDANISRDNIGFFLQDVFHVNDQIDITGGIRYDVLTKFDNQFNYRFAATGLWDNGVYAKLMYGTAYRVPAYREYYTSDVPNADLTPEFLKTFEAQVGYMVNSKADINLTMYNNNYTNFIQEIVVDSIDDGSGVFTEIDDEMSFNFDSRSITGLELNSNIRPQENIALNVGLSYMLSATETMGEIDESIYTSQVLTAGKSDILFLSNFNAFIVSNYTIAENYSVGLNAIYFSDRNVPVDYQTESEVQNPDNAKGFVKFDLTASAKLMDKKLTINAKICNLLDADIYSPPYGGQGDYDIEWPGRTFRIGVNYNFAK
jgi:outer membrane receptor for ferrienterochelin and colicins